MPSCRTCRWLGFAIRFSRGSQAVRRRLYHIPRRRGLPFDLTREGKVCGQGFFRGISQVSKEMKKEKGEGGNKKLTPSKESEEEEGCLDRAERRDAHRIEIPLSFSLHTQHNSHSFVGGGGGGRRRTFVNTFLSSL